MFQLKNAAQYIQLANSISPGDLNLVYPMWERKGTVGYEQITGLKNLTYTSVTLDNTKFVTGDRAPIWDGINDIAENTAINPYIDQVKGTIAIWVKVNAAFWVDDSFRMFWDFRLNSNNYFQFGKHSNNKLRIYYYGNGSVGAFTTGIVPSNLTTWWLCTVTYDITGSQRVEVYENDAYLSGVNTTPANVMVGPPTSLNVGSRPGGTWGHVGNLAYFMHWKSKVLALADIQKLYRRLAA